MFQLAGRRLGSAGEPGKRPNVVNEAEPDPGSRPSFVHLVAAR
jgi:hypothetical protein